MRGVLEVRAEDIQRIDQFQLVSLLGFLLRLEAQSNNIAMSSIHVPENINVADGGEDGFIAWESGPERTNYLPRRYNSFQIKKQNMSKSKCKAEVINKDGSLKARLKKCLNSNGAYIVFCNEHSVKKDVDERIEGIKQGIGEAGYKLSEVNAFIDFYDSNKIASWANCYPSAALWIHEIITPGAFTGFQTWEKWGGNPDVSGFTFIGDKESTKHIEQIRKSIHKPRSVVRVVGLSGLGKTRLVFESFRPQTTPSDNDQIHNFPLLLFSFHPSCC